MLSTVWSRTGFPAISRNCFGIPAFMRVPVPPAAMTAAALNFPPELCVFRKQKNATDSTDYHRF
jgi:hypothetical protein